ncbi:MAG: thioredoxin family protein [Flavobacteriales bacterium]|nr:thioredoxin family protein [Flavobacteriales bacterium]
MRKFIAFTLLFISFTSSYAQEEINWMTWDEMIQQREKDSTNKKKVFIDFTTGWCGWCKKMDATTFKDPSVIQYMNSNYYPVKFDAETRDTIEFNGHTFTNSDPAFVKSSPTARGRTHWFAYSILDGATSYPSYVVLDENLTRLSIYPGYKTQEELIGILVFFATDQYKYYHNYLNKIWNESLKKPEDSQNGK